ncbi:hypothetical protein [Lysinibacillus sp. NPDC056232]|uniref:hypothetical protein n=1 Tax=Lysinibacillus sp. NPDC056232 TaxID=3345756 RepID=UPI0035DDDAD0
MGISVTDETLERAHRGTKAKSITSCDNAFVTNIVLAQAAHRTPPGSFALCESEASATKRPVGAEINPSFCRRVIFYYDALISLN